MAYDNPKKETKAQERAETIGGNVGKHEGVESAARGDKQGGGDLGMRQTYKQTGRVKGL